MAIYTYTKSPVAIDSLSIEIDQSSLVGYEYANFKKPNSLTIAFQSDLSGPDKIILDDIVSDHLGEEIYVPSGDVFVADGRGGGEYVPLSSATKLINKVASFNAASMTISGVNWNTENFNHNIVTKITNKDIKVSTSGIYEINYKLNWQNETSDVKGLMANSLINDVVLDKGTSYGHSPGAEIPRFTLNSSFLVDLAENDIVSVNVPCLISGVEGWYDNDFLYRKQFTIDSSQIEAETTSVKITDTSYALCENYTSKTVAHTVGSEDNRIVIVAVGIEGDTGEEISSVTFNDVAMTHIITKLEDPGYHAEVSLWYMLEADLPSAGTYNVVATAGALCGHIGVGCWTVTGLKQQAPEATASNGNQGATHISANITTLTNNAWTFEAVVHGTTSDFCPNSGQTEDFDDCTSSFRFGGGHDIIASSGLTNQEWYSSSSLRNAIVIAAFEVDSVSSAHTNFPVYVEATGLDGKAHAQAWDVIFVQDATQQILDHEIHGYESGSLKAWVRVPSLSATEDTDISMYYGNTNISSSQENAIAVWNSDYEAVLHLQESGSGTDGEFKDSTSNTHNATGGGVAGSGNSSYTPTRVSGKLGYAQDYSDDIIRLDNVSDQAWPAVTVQIWINADTYNQDSRIFSKTWGTNSTDIVWMLRATSYDDIGSRMRTNAAANGGYDNSGAEYDTGIWTLATVTWDSADNKLRVYKDGVEKGNTTLTGDNLYDYTIEPCIGNSINRDRDYDGKLQEARLSKIARSAAWLKTEFNNQNSPETFITFGLEEEGPSCNLSEVTLLGNESVLEVKLIREGD